jgi:hypothetical protein
MYKVGLREATAKPDIPSREAKDLKTSAPELPRIEELLKKLEYLKISGDVSSAGSLFIRRLEFHRGRPPVGARSEPLS